MDEEALSKARRRWVRRFDAVNGERWTRSKDRSARHRCAKRKKGQPKRGYGACYSSCPRGAQLARVDERRYCAAFARWWGGDDAVEVLVGELARRCPIERGRGRWRAKG